MSKEGRDLVSEAVNDSKQLKEAALNAAKNQVIEALAPKIRQLLEKELKGALSQNEDADRLRRGDKNGDNWPGESHTGFEEAKEKGDTKMSDETKNNQELDMEALASFFPPMSEMPEEDPLADVQAEDAFGQGGIPTLGTEAKGAPEDEEEQICAPEAPVKEGKKKDDDEEKDTMDEEIEISESELKKVYEASLQTEVAVTKGFGEMTPMGELDDVAKDVDKGIADVKKGEHAWDKETPPSKEDFTVKEARSLIARGMAENKALRENNKKAMALIQKLASRLHEVNLFNAKVFHVNRILNTNARLTKEQKKVVLESLDKAKSISEVKSLYETLASTFAVSTQLSESKTRKPVGNAQASRTSGGANQKVLRESVDRSSTEGQQFSRLQQLAGLGLINK